MRFRRAKMSRLQSEPRRRHCRIVFRDCFDRFGRVASGDASVFSSTSCTGLRVSDRLAESTSETCALGLFDLMHPLALHPREIVFFFADEHFVFSECCLSICFRAMLQIDAGTLVGGTNQHLVQLHVNLHANHWIGRRTGAI